MLFIRFIVTVIIFLAYQIYAESQFITFTAKDYKNQKEIKLDSIKIHNITKNRDTVLIGIQSIDLSLISDVQEQSRSNLKSLFISQNYPNEFNYETKFNVCTPSPTNLKLSLIDLLGNNYTESNFYIEPGSQTFRLSGSGLNNGIYFLSVQTKNETKCVKIIKTGNSDKSDVYFELINTSNQVTNKISETLIAQTDNFNFIGYSKTYKQSLMNEITPIDSQNFEFDMSQYEPNIKYNSGMISIRNFWSKEIYEESTRRIHNDSLISQKRDTINKFIDSISFILENRLLSEIDSNSNYKPVCDSSIFYSDSIIFCLENSGSFEMNGSYITFDNYTLCSFIIDTLNKVISFELFQSSSGKQSSNKIIYNISDINFIAENIPYNIDSLGVISSFVSNFDLLQIIKTLRKYYSSSSINLANDISNFTTRISDGINQVDNNSFLLLKLYP